MTELGLTLAHAACTLAMTGLIWFVQCVHYPLFPFAAQRSFTNFAAQHQRRTGWVVGPLMLVEAATAVLLAARRPDGWTLVGAGLLALIWLSTLLWQMPLHRRLARGFEPAAAASLVRTNWLRTAAWTARAAIALVLVGEMGGN